MEYIKLDESSEIKKTSEKRNLPMDSVWVRMVEEYPSELGYRYDAEGYRYSTPIKVNVDALRNCTPKFGGRSWQDLHDYLSDWYSVFKNPEWATQNREVPGIGDVDKLTFITWSWDDPADERFDDWNEIYEYIEVGMFDGINFINMS